MCSNLELEKRRVKPSPNCGKHDDPGEELGELVDDEVRAHAEVALSPLVREERFKLQERTAAAREEVVT